jgi:hypothetical protein
MSKRKLTPRSKQLKLATPRRQKNKLDEAKETRQFFGILAVATLLLVLFMYLIFMKTGR